MNIVNRVKGYLFPKLSEQAEADIDAEAVKNIYYICLVVSILESAVLVLFLISRPKIDEASYVSIRSVAFCIAACVLGNVVSRVILEKEYYNHRFIVVFEIIYFIALSIWGLRVSYRHYIAGEQMLTFFTVELMMACFVLIRPIISTVLMSSAYITLYITAYLFDGAERINFINYFMFMLLSIIGMVVRYHLQLRTSKRKVSLANDKLALEAMSRMDGLTGLNNRRALEDDVEELIGKPVRLYMVDINYFKEINDNYGHMAGDDILRETGERLRILYPGSRYYRYGGDEFLVINDDNELTQYGEDTYKFRWTDRNVSVDVLFSIGRSSGTPGGRDEFFALVSEADEKLYETKTWTHDPEHGGHERRRSTDTDNE